MSNSDANEPQTKWCAKCAANVTPTQPTGQCPGCGRPLPGSSLARKHRANKARVKELLDEFIREYQPSTQRLRSMCEQFAAVTEQLENGPKLGSLERGRLSEESQRLGAALEASRSSRAPQDNAVDAMNTDQLIAETSEILRELLLTKDAEARPKAGRTGVDLPLGPDQNAGPTAVSQASDSGSGPAPAGSPDCPYCSDSRSRRPCVGPGHDSYSVLHWQDPVEVDRRAAEATKEMLEAFRRQRDGDPWVR